MEETLVQPDQITEQALAGLSPRKRLWTLFVACMGVLLVISSMVALNTALADISVATSATQTQLTWMVDGYTLALACLLLPAGAIGDRYGRRGALLIGLAIFAIASVAPVIWSDPTPIIIARAVAGAGAAFVMPATLSLLTSAYPKDQRAKAVGVWAGVSGCAAVVGMLGSGLLLHYWSWHSIFWAFAAAGAILFGLTFTVGTSKDPEAKPLDWIGAVVIGSAVAVLVFGILDAPARGWTDPLVLGCLAAGVALSVAFGVIELRLRHPLLDVRLFKIPEFATGSAAITVYFASLFGFFYLAMQYIQLVMGYTPIRTAFALSPLVVPILILSAASSWYVPRVGLRLVVFAGLLFMAAGFLCLRVLALDSPYWDLAWPLLIMSTGIGLCIAPTTSAIMMSAPDDKQGVASAVNDTTREVGAALGIALAGSMLAAKYTDLLSPQLASLPEPARDAASSSLGRALEVAGQLGPQGGQLADLAKAAFLQGMESALLALAVIIASSAVLIGLWAPGRDGQQLKLVRRLARRPSAQPEANPTAN
jgi:EmrB/QacA subfamily drug resistance transporter